MRRKFTLMLFAFLGISAFAADDIVISPESGTDIAAELASAKESVEAVGNITINLAEGGEYTVSAPIVASQSLVINGNGAKIDASALSGAFIQLSSSPTAPFLKKYDNSGNTDYYGIAKINITGINVISLKKSIFYDNNKKYCVLGFTIDNCVFSLETEAVDYEALISFQAGGAKDFTIKNSTVYGNNAVAKYFIRYNNAARLDRFGFDKDKEFETFTYTNNTFYGLLKSDGQWGNYSGFAGQKYTAFDVKKNIWMNCGENKIAQRMLGGRQASTYKNCTFDKNTYTHFDYASGQLIFEDEGTDAVKDDGETLKATYDVSKSALLSDPYFRDPVHGDFALEAGSEQALNKTGDPHWGTWSAPGTDYVITVDEAENGTVTVDVLKAEQGTEVTVTATPAEGYEVDVITVKDADGTEISVTEGKFIMPGKPVTITATFKLSTGIEAVKTAEGADLENAVIYNLNGQRVEKAQKGINIVNGKKVVIK